MLLDHIEQLDRTFRLPTLSTSTDGNAETRDRWFQAFAHHLLQEHQGSLPLATLGMRIQCGIVADHVWSNALFLHLLQECGCSLPLATALRIVRALRITC